MLTEKEWGREMGRELGTRRNLTWKLPLLWERPEHVCPQVPHPSKGDVRRSAQGGFSHARHRCTASKGPPPWTSQVHFAAGQLLAVISIHAVKKAYFSLSK